MVACFRFTQATPVRSFLILLLCLLSAPGANAAGETIQPAPPADTSYPLIVAQDHSVLFKISPETTPISCVGKFANTDGNFDGPFPGSVRVKFGAAAAGRSNPCTITLTRAGGPNGQPAVTQTIFLQVIVPKVVSRTLAHVPGSSDDRVTIGVGEEVMMTLQPGEMLLDSDVTWSVGHPWDTLSRRTGLGTIYQAGFPGRADREHRKFAANEGSDAITPFLKEATDEVALSFGGRSPDTRSDRVYLAFVRQHSSAALAAAYRAKLDRIEAQLDAHGWSTDPVMVAFSRWEKTDPHFFVSAKGFDPALVAVATLQSRLPEGGDQPENLQGREIRLVARTVAMFHRAVDPAFATEPCPNPWSVQPPAGYTSRREIIVGMVEPEDIREPDLRRQYREAIAANNAKITAWYKQSRADRDDGTLRRFAYSYLQELCGRSDPRLKQYRQVLIACGLDARTAREFSKKPPE